MNQNALTHNLVRRPPLLVIAALLAGLALAFGVVLLAQAAPATVLQLPEPTYLALLPDQVTNTLPDSTHEFTATVLSQYGIPMQGVMVSFSTDFGQFQGDGQYVEVQTNVFGQAGVTIVSATAGTAHIRAWLDDGDDTYESGELTDDLSTKVWQEADQPDFGDAPDSYGTLLASNGARHTMVAGRQLGLTVDGESDAQLPLDASGDDVNGLDDEDGVVLPPILVLGFPAAVVVDGGPLGGMLDAWIDFNGNGVFDHPGEHLFGGTSRALTSGPNPNPLNPPPLLHRSGYGDRRDYLRPLPPEHKWWFRAHGASV
jgi:hypothetical protein